MSWSFLDLTGLSRFFGRLPEKLVTTDTTQTISGTKSFSSTILGSVSGSAASASKDGSGNVIADTYETKADAATHLTKTEAASAYVQTGAVDQTVAGTKTFSKPIVGSVTGSSGSCTGNAATATTATKATQDAAGNTITTTYATKAENNTKANNSEVVHKSGNETISGAKTFTGDVIGINKERSTEDANSLYSTTAGSKLTYYTTSNGGTTLTNVPATVNTTLESRTIRRLSDSDWIVEQICHNSNGLYYRKGSNGTWGAWKTFAFTDSDISGNAATATKATGNANGKELTNTIIKGLSISGKTITYTQIDGNTGTLTTQDTVYTHPTTAGNKHIPSGGSSGQFLGWASDGTAKWVNNPNTNTDTLMTQNVSTTNATYPVLLVATADATANQGAKTGIFAKSVKVNPSTNVISASGFSGPLTGNVTGNCSGSSGSCTGNSATATKLAAARTIALSGAATGTATGFDGTADITIPVTALSGSAITSAITIYDLVPDGAANHRNFYRGKDITAAFNNGTVSANIANGTFRDIFPGDYITKSVTVPQILKADGTTEYIAQTAYNVRFIIADLDVWLNRGDAATTAHHVAIVPERAVFNSCMNETNVTDGGYLGSFMNTNVMPAFATGLQGAFGNDHILQFRFLDTKAVNNDLKPSGVVNYTGATYWGGHDWTSHYCHLMTETMVYGAPITASCTADEIMGGVQFAAFRLNSNLVYNRQNYWLSDVVSSALFARVGGGGSASANDASGVFGVRPFALLC